jgi:hypothetical protein
MRGQLASGRRREIYHFRDEQGLEVDFVVPGRRGTVALVEGKAGRPVTPAMAAPLTRLGEACKASAGRKSPTPRGAAHRLQIVGGAVHRASPHGPFRNHTASIAGPTVSIRTQLRAILELPDGPGPARRKDDVVEARWGDGVLSQR